MRRSARRTATMKPIPHAIGFLALVPFFQQTAPDPSGPLQRIPPQDESEERDLSGLFAREFNAQRWRELLATPDLDRREEYLDTLLKRAGLDPAARAFLEDLAKDPKGGELAWTARLALRQLGRARFPLQDPFSADPFGRAGQLEEMLRDFMSQDDWNFFQIQPHKLGDPLKALRGQGSQGRSVHFEQNERGARVEITEERDGQPEVRTYEGATLDEILAQNPELEDELGDLAVRVQPGAPLGLDFHLGPRNQGRGVPPAPFGNDLRERQQPAQPLRTDKLGVIVRPLTPEHRRELGLEEGQGLYVERSANGTFAHLLGIGSGDVLLEIDGQSVGTEDELGNLMAKHAADAPLTVTWIDELGQRRTKTWPGNIEPKAQDDAGQKQPR